MKNDGKDLSRKAGSGRNDLKRVPELKKMKEGPTKSIFVNDFYVASMTIRIVLIRDDPTPPSNRGYEGSRVYVLLANPLVDLLMDY
uniref:Uncharacterized protein n=1 Tax=Lepeophtheirus salmonis TaxID=72036 RepID=A0A0K2VHV5_LEPSM